MPDRREILQGLAGLGCGAALRTGAPARAAAGRETVQKEVKMAQTGSDVGSLFPFIERQAVRSPSLSFLREEFRDLAAWKGPARQKLVDLLHYAPPKCDPQAEVIGRVDRGDYVQETVRFNTTPDLRVPAYVLIPKKAHFPAPAIVALHDHGGFYFWGKEKLVEADDEHPVMAAFKRAP